jgi:hypothetical protein
VLFEVLAGLDEDRVGAVLEVDQLAGALAEPLASGLEL